MHQFASRPPAPYPYGYMLISVTDLERDPLEFNLGVPSTDVGYGELLTQLGDLAVEGRADLIHEHRGPREIVPDIRVRLKYSGNFETPCARCLEPVAIPLSGSVDLIFRPTGVDATGSERAISTGETEIGYYENGSLLLEDVLREQVLLSLPGRTLCREDCKGLCPRCGQNWNLQACNCDSQPVDLRWSALAGLRSHVKPD